MRFISIASVLGLAFVLLAPSPAPAQKIIHFGTSHVTLKPAHVRVRKFGRLVHGPRRKGLPRVRFSIFALPDQMYFPPFYEAPRPWRQRPDMAGRIKGGPTVRQGSPWRGHIAGGLTVEGGSRWASHIEGGKSVESGSRWAGHIEAGRTVEQGSRWAGTMANWRFSGYAAPMRPKGIPYYRAMRYVRSPWASRLY